LSGREIKAQQKQVVSRRFNRAGRNTLWQADLKYGPYLPSPKLRIRHLNTKAYSPESKGKCEKFNQTVDEFIREVQLEKPQTLERLNELFRAWLSEGYNHRIHSALAGKTPAQAFSQDTKPLRFPGPEALRDAFLWEKSPKVDNSGCMSVNGLCYEAGVEHIRKRVMVRYDPFDLSVVEVWSEGEKKKLVSPANTGEHNRNVKSRSKKLEKVSQSRLLRLFEAESKKRLKQQLGAFRLSEEETDNDPI